MTKSRLLKYALLGIAAALIAHYLIEKEEKPKGHPRDYAEIAAEGIIHASTEYNSISFYVDDDTLSGFHYELIEAFARDHGLQAAISPEMSFNKRLEGLADGQYDVIAYGILATSELKDSLLLTTPIVLNKQVLVQRKLENISDSSLFIKSQLDLAGKTLHVVKGSPSILRIRNREELEAGAAMSASKIKTIRVTEAVGGNVTYDLVGELVQITGLTRRTIVSILQGIAPATFHQFKLNPEEFIIKTGRIINDCKAISLIQHIKYEKRDHTFDSNIFEEVTLRGTLGKDAIESQKSLYDLVVVDSQGIEKSFAESLEKEDDVVVYSKLPGGFYINTPMGKYNPDWAVAFREGSVKHIYFIAETKGNDIEVSQLRKAEDAKIECARRHFATISTGEVVYSVVKTYQDLYNAVMK